MDASIASERDPSNPLKLLALSAGGVAAVAVIVAAATLMLRWASGAFAPGAAGGILAVAVSAIILITAAAAGLRPLRLRAAIHRSVEMPRSAEQLKSPRPFPEARPWPEAKLVQRIERYERQGPNGSVVEAAVGRIVVRFLAGSRAAVAHVGFCPPFVATPRVAVSNDCDGVEVDVAAAEVLPWGVRIECRLEEPSEEPLDVEVEIIAEPMDAP